MPKQTENRAATLAVHLTARLNQLGMSRRELSRRTGLSRQTIHNIEHAGSTNLKPSTFSLLDEALKWEPGTSLAYAMGHSDYRQIEAQLSDYLTRIAIHLSHMDSAQLELTLIMMEENQLGTHPRSTAEFSTKVGLLVERCLKDIAQLHQKPQRKHAS